MESDPDPLSKREKTLPVRAYCQLDLPSELAARLA